MASFMDKDLTGSTFTRVDLTDARFEEVDFSGAFLRNIYLSGARLRGAWLKNVDIDGEIDGLTVNGVDIGPLVAAELTRRHPERRLLDPTDADGFRVAWTTVKDAWGPTMDRARALPETALHERVDSEWSFLETLRHLVFCTDAWVSRAILGQVSPYWEAGVVHDENGGDPPAPIDPAADPGLAEVLAARAERWATVDAVMAALTDEQLGSETEPVLEPGYPESIAFPVRRCLDAVVQEEWLHRLFAERDLAVLLAAPPGADAGE